MAGVGSGGTITVGRALGYTREAAVRLSFLMAIPAVFGSGLLEAVKAVKNYKTDAMFPGWGPTLVAMVISFVLGYIVIIGFLKFVSNFSYKAFASTASVWLWSSPCCWLWACCRPSIPPWWLRHKTGR